MNLRPLNDVVFIDLQKPEKQTASGIVIPDSAQAKNCEGVVIAAGPGMVSQTTGERIPLAVTAGDRVIVGKYAGSEVDVGNKKLIFVREAEIVAVIEPEEAQAAS